VLLVGFIGLLYACEKGKGGFFFICMHVETLSFGEEA
jgi:hypothetical protein